MKYCLNCNTHLEKNIKKYCSNKCQKEYEYKKYIKDWKDGKISGMRGKYQISRLLKVENDFKIFFKMLGI